MWLTAFLDLPAASHDEAVAFWCAVTGSGLSPIRGATGEFATLLPGDGDRDAEVERLRALGATVVRRTNQWTTLRDPAGLELCVTDRDPDTGGLP
jgi:hypothetical protein